MKLGDKTIFGSYKDVEKNLNKLFIRLTQTSSRIQVSNSKDYIGFALEKIIVYASKQVKQLISCIDSPIELNAWIARNLFECYLIGAYIISNPLKAKEFLANKALDELEINEGILSLTHSGVSKNIEKSIQERNDHIIKTLKKHNLERIPYWTVSMLAKQTGNKNEYDAFFKLYSKYVHPSSWIITGDSKEYDNHTYRNIFLVQSQYYLSCLLKIGEDYIQKQLVKE